MKKQWIAIFLCLSLLATGLLRLTGCAAKMQADDLMKGITPEKTSGRAADDAFKNGAADFAVRLFQNTQEEGKNSLISPLSVMLALSMTANGAKGETLAQMEVLLGGDIRSIRSTNISMPMSAACLCGKAKADAGQFHLGSRTAALR